MLTRLGRGPSTPRDVAGALLECHARIRHFTAVALRLAAEGKPDAATSAAAAAVARYFGTALPLHVADEEQSIAPRLAGAGPEVDRALETMRGEHRDAEEHVVGITAACSALAAAPERFAELTGAIARHATALDAHWASHLGLEEQVLLPALRRLDVALQDEIVAEMKRRRDAPGR